MSYWLHEEAASEFDAAATYYAERATRKIAIAVLEEFERVIDILQVNQQLGAQKDEGMRVYPLRRFPYSIVYREDGEAGPQVYAFAHQSREPGYWKSRQ